MGAAEGEVLELGERQPAAGHFAARGALRFQLRAPHFECDAVARDRMFEAEERLSTAQAQPRERHRHDGALAEHGRRITP